MDVYSASLDRIVASLKESTDRVNTNNDMQKQFSLAFLSLLSLNLDIIRTPLNVSDALYILCAQGFVLAKI